MSLPIMLTDIPDDAFVERYQQAAQAIGTAWDEDAVLTEERIVPPGISMPGFAALGHYITELLAHGWDLAVATGQQAAAPAAIAQAALEQAQSALPAASRGGQTRFGPPVAVPSDADPTRKLAAWLGRPDFC